MSGWVVPVGLRCCLLVLAAAGTAAERVVALAGPLSTIVPVEDLPADGVGGIVAEIEVPATAPDDLGLGAFVAEYDGTWYQRLHPGTLGPGRHVIRFDLSAAAAVHGEPHRTGWNGLVARQGERAGIFFWTARAGGTVTVVDLAALPPPATAPDDGHRLVDLQLEAHDPVHGVVRGRTGRRWEVRFRPEPAPENPFEPARFAAHLEVTDPTGAVLVAPAYYAVPWTYADRGDAEAAKPAGHGRFHLRFRPRRPGRHRLRLVACWNQGTAAAYPDIDGLPATAAAPRRELSVALPDLVVEGAAWDPYVRIDAADPRFFCTGRGEERRLFWPVGMNIRSVNDPRGRKYTGSLVTPDRGLLAYRAYLRRLAAAGGNAVEVWLSSWNLALEWRRDWPGFHGVARYHLANADRLDRLLDLAWEEGIRLNLVVHNHGQASCKTDAEWQSSPYNVDRGGFLSHPREFFTDPRALAGQERLRRYLVGRYADHPAVMAWKLWSEINLTACAGSERPAWHRRAAQRWHALDGYGHPTTTHWSGHYRVPDQATAFLPELDFLCIDAYHGGRGPGLTQLLWDSTNQPKAGLTVLGGLAGRQVKPVVVTEYGGNWNAAPRKQLIAEHQSAAWVALVSGHAGAPMLWWFEWVDQHDLWRPFGAIQAFLAGEDLRSTSESPTRPVRLVASSGGIWVGAWARSGRVLGYLQDRRWGALGTPVTEQRDVVVTLSDRPDLPGGPMAVEWWNPDDGTLLSRRRFDHPGGPLLLRAPPFHRHLAFKACRIEEPDRTPR